MQIKGIKKHLFNEIYFDNFLSLNVHVLNDNFAELQGMAITCICFDITWAIYYVNQDKWVISILLLN